MIKPKPSHLIWFPVQLLRTPELRWHNSTTFIAFFLGRSVSNFFNNRCKSSRKGRKVHLVLKELLPQKLFKVFFMIIFSFSDFLSTTYLFCTQLGSIYILRWKKRLGMGGSENSYFPLLTLCDENVLTWGALWFLVSKHPYVIYRCSLIVLQKLKRQWTQQLYTPMEKSWMKKLWRIESFLKGQLS